MSSSLRFIGSPQSSCLCKKYKKSKIGLAFFLSYAIIILHFKSAAVVQRLVPMLAMHMMTVRFRSVAPVKM